MAPTSLTTLAAFVLLIAPGLAWSMLEGRWRPPVVRTVFDEISRTVVASLLATAAATICLWWWLWGPALTRISQLPAEPSLMALLPVGRAVAATSALACLLVTSAHIARRRSWKGPVQGGDAWHRAFTDHPDQRPRAFVWVEMSDGAAWKGEVLHHDLGSEGSNRGLLLDGPLSRRDVGDSRFNRVNERWGRLLLATKDIVSIRVTFLANEYAGEEPE